jgi:peptidylprolyl isomerase
VITLLMGLFSDASPTVRGSALGSLSARLKDGAETFIKTALADTNSGVRVAAVDAAQNLTTDMEAILQQADLDDNVLVRDEVLGALNTVATDTAFATIRRALSSDALSERNSAVFALEGRKEASIPALFYSTYLNSVSDAKWNGTREEIAGDLAAIPGDETTGYLQTMTADPDYLVATQAITALMARGITGLPPVPNKTLTYSPYRDLEFRRDPIIVFETAKGRIEIQGHDRSAQITTASIAGFAESGAYDGLPWHRVVSDFIIQGGDPDKTGYGDAGWDVRSEINSWKFERGSVGIARTADFDSGSVQIFINTVPTPFLDGQYTVFAQVIDGMDVVDRIEMGDLILKAFVK